MDMTQQPLCRHPRSGRGRQHLHDVAQHVAEAALLPLHPEVYLFDGVQQRAQGRIPTEKPAVFPPQQAQELQAAMLFQHLRNDQQVAINAWLFFTLLGGISSQAKSIAVPQPTDFV